MKLQNKVALVTGAGSGLGEAAACLLAREGAKIGVLSRTQSEIDELAENIREAGGEAMALRADISEPEEMEAAIAQLREKWGRLDIVFANAGVNGVWAPLEELTIDDWKKTLAINLDGTFYTVKLALPLLQERGGSVIITSSVNGTRMFSNTGATAYATSKAGQVAFAKMIAVELARKKIRVNVICPGAIDTAIEENTEKRSTEKLPQPVEFPEGRIPLTGERSGTSDQVAKLVLFLASDESDHITGTEIFIDGAQSLLQG
ncbi:MAG TPA: SDR family NAD(P)-dependent oxidoreductase [Chthoniobacteraceae bacterium]